MRAIIAIPILVLLSCGPVTSSTQAPVSESEYLDDGWGKTSIVTIRDCEYICYVTAGGYGAGVCHAGDCRNPIHHEP